MIDELVYDNFKDAIEAFFRSQASPYWHVVLMEAHNADIAKLEESLSIATEALRIISCRQ